MTKPGKTKVLTGLITIVEAYSRALRKAGATENADRLTLLNADLHAVRGDRIADFRKRVANVESTAACGDEDSFSTVLPVLAELGEFLAAAGARGFSADLSALSAVLKTIGTLPLGGSGSILAATPVKKPKATRPSSKVDVTKSAREIAERLTRANQDDAGFKALMGELRARSYSKSVVEAAANIFLGHSDQWRYRSKDEALKKIEARHALDAISDSRQRTINRINA